MKSGRKDHKNRLLREGESQNKDGRYRYSYYENGKQKSFYSWKLEPTDKLPAGKKECVSLREQIEKLQKKQLLYGKYSESCKLRSNGMPVPLLRNCYSIFNGMKYR